MYSKSKQKAQVILQMYNSGKILTEICKETKSSQPTVKKILAENGIDYDSLEKQKYQEKLELVKKLYSEGKSQVYIEKELGLTRKTIRTLLKGSDIHYKSKSEQWRLRYGNTLREDAFETITPESAYWIGFLYADGHITKKGFSVELGVELKDKPHLEKFLSFLDCSNSISYDKRGNFCRVRIGSEKLHMSLKNLGFDHKKSYTARPHKSLYDSIDFWRGVVDGDGCLSWLKTREYELLHLCGTKDTIQGLIDFLLINGISTKANPTKANGKELYQVSFASEKANQVATLLYKDSTIHLDRKYEIWKSWNSESNND